MNKDELREYMEATLQRLTPAKAQEMARSVMEGERKDQVQKMARDLLDWSNRSRKRLSEAVQKEVRDQLKAVGVASRDEVEALKRRVRELEREVGVAGATKKPAARRAGTKKSTAKPTTTATAN